METALTWLTYSGPGLVTMPRGKVEPEQDSKMCVRGERGGEERRAAGEGARGCSHDHGGAPPEVITQPMWGHLGGPRQLGRSRLSFVGGGGDECPQDRAGPLLSFHSSSQPDHSCKSHCTESLRGESLILQMKLKAGTVAKVPGSSCGQCFSLLFAAVNGAGTLMGERILGTLSPCPLFSLNEGGHQHVAALCQALWT